MSNLLEPRAFKVFQRKQLDRIPQIARLDREQQDAIRAVSAVLPFRVNNYVLEDLIDWDRVPDDPMFQLTFPQAGMLHDEDFATMLDLVRRDAPEAEIQAAARTIQFAMNPHPAGQKELNVPRLDGQLLQGMQHKYRQTVLFFPANGQTCHSYCTYCFRWAQFVGIDELKFLDREADHLVRYVAAHPEITDVLFTGGDPMVMSTKVLRRYVEPLLRSGLDHLKTIRFGTKAPAYWPYRFTQGPDSDDLIQLFEEIVAAGKHVALMAHYSHPVELETEVAQQAVRRIIDSGAVVRCQAPLIRHVNDDADTWARMWQTQVDLGAVPYYMFVERDTGARDYFEVPLAEAFDIYNRAYAQVSGVARTVRGPSMSATPGKVCVDGIAEVHGEKVFVLKFLQCRRTEWANRIFFAKFDPQAMWLDDLEPAFGESEFFYEGWMRELAEHRKSGLNDMTPDGLPSQGVVADV